MIPTPQPPSLDRAQIRAELEAVKASQAAIEATSQDAGGSLAAVLLAIYLYIRRYVVVTESQVVAVTLHVAHTHSIAAADTTPYLHVTSATKRAGKTRLLEVLEPIVARPWLTGRTSAAALVRKVDSGQPTLLLDESDAAFGGEKEYAEALRGILNSGYKRSGKCSLCIGKGAGLSVRDFSTFSPKIIAGIGTLPHTVADRAIPIVLQRKMTSEPVARWRDRDGRAEAAPLRHSLAAWAGTAIEALRAARPSLPSELSDRAQDVWEPLLAIADLAGGDWPTRARRAAVALMGVTEDTDPRIELLTDIRDILADDNIVTSGIAPTKELIEKLIAREDRPWATWRKSEKPITARGLARLLGPLGLHPDRHLRTVRGYRADGFTEVMARYLPIQVSQCHNPNEYGAKPRDRSEFEAEGQRASDTLFSPDIAVPVTHGRIDQGDTATGDDSRVGEQDDDDDQRY